jgi:Putative MetA-pathway of phenol degradation
LRLSVNFYGAPALSLQEFAGYRQDLIIGARVQVSALLGQYDNDKLVNLGNNRWLVKPDIGISKAWGTLVLDLSTGVTFFSKNDDVFGSKTLEQGPVSTTQLRVTYKLGGGIRAALSGTYDCGGRTTIDGVQSDDLENNVRVGATLSLPLNRNNSSSVTPATALAPLRGSDYDLFGLVWQHRCGQGLQSPIRFAPSPAHLSAGLCWAKQRVCPNGMNPHPLRAAWTGRRSGSECPRP